MVLILSQDNFKVNGSAIPFQIRRRMKTFPRSLRILPLASVLQTILAIYVDKSRTDLELLRKGIPTPSLAEYVYDFYEKTLGVGAIVDVQVVQLLTACAYHTTAHKRVALFAFQIGLHNTEVHPDLDSRDTTFILSIIRELSDIGELVADPAPVRLTAPHSF